MPEAAKAPDPIFEKARMTPWGPAPAYSGKPPTTEASIHVLTATFVEEELEAAHQQVVDLIGQGETLDEILDKLRYKFQFRGAELKPPLRKPDEASRAHRNEIRRLLFELYGVDYTLEEN